MCSTLGVRAGLQDGPLPHPSCAAEGRPGNLAPEKTWPMKAAPGELSDMPRECAQRQPLFQREPFSLEQSPVDGTVQWLGFRKPVPGLVQARSSQRKAGWQRLWSQPRGFQLWLYRLLAALTHTWAPSFLLGKLGEQLDLPHRVLGGLGGSG